MRTKALVLAAHGSRHEPAVNAQIRDSAAQIAALEAFDEVAVAFHQGAPPFCEVLDGLRAEDVTVVPVMTSAGYYSDTVLPGELAKNQRYPQIKLRITAPLGLSVAIPDMVKNRVQHLLNGYDFPGHETTVALVGHGTPRHTASRNATFSLARRLASLGCCGEVIALFLDDEPPVDELPARVTKPNVIVVPFLIASGPHALSDIPRRIGLKPPPNQRPPFAGATRGKKVVCDIPVGAYPGIVELIVDLACAPSRTGVTAPPLEVA